MRSKLQFSVGVALLVAPLATGCTGKSKDEDFHINEGPEEPPERAKKEKPQPDPEPERDPTANPGPEDPTAESAGAADPEPRPEPEPTKRVNTRQEKDPS